MDEKDFNRAYQAASRALEEEDATGHGSEFEGQRGKYVEKEESTTINNAVEQILSADAKKDYFRCVSFSYGTSRVFVGEGRQGCFLKLSEFFDLVSTVNLNQMCMI